MHVVKCYAPQCSNILLMDECYRLYDIAGIGKYLAMFQGSCGHISRGDASGDNPNE